MSYQVLARKWRPRNFQEMVGQQHVLRALVNALDQGRLHHAYLFTGTRGVGKTTLARIIAKCLNCETGVTSTPCGVCDSCREIDEGRFLDLIEVDAASRTKVEDTRELLENVQYAPTRGRYKVYLIDEVHMLSGHSFNALLKTLEEPPPHVKFLLATTDPQRLPVTVLSRCLQFNLKRLPAEMIAEHLAKLLDAEKIQAEPAALRQLALAADGSMRDALSLLDQAIAFGEGAVREPEVLDMLGGISREHVHALLNTLAAGDGSHLLSEVAKLAEQAPDYSAVLADLITLLQQIALIQQVPELSDERVDEPELIRQIATTLNPEDVQLYYQIALMGRRDLPLSPDPRGGFEMVLLRMLAFRPDAAAEPAGGSRPGSSERPAPSAGNPSAPPAKPASAPKASYAEPAPAAPRVSEPPPAERTPPRPAPARAADPNAPWTEVVPALGLTGMSLQLANHCMPAGRDGKAFKLKLSREHESLLGPRSVERLEQALCDYYQDALKLSVEVVDELTETPAAVAQRNDAARENEAREAIEQDPVAHALQETFGAELITGSIKPIT